MDERQQAGLVYALSEIAMSLKFERNMNRLETEQYPVQGTPLNPFENEVENEVDPFADDANPITDYENAMHELKKLQQEHNELLSVIAPLKDFSEETLASYGAWCNGSRPAANDMFVKSVGVSGVAGFYVRLGEVVDRINEWHNGR